MTDKERIRMEKAIEDAMWGFEPNDNGDYEYADMEEMFMEGAKWQKEQMMKDAICTIMQRDDCNDLVPTIGDMSARGFEVGDKVKVIIIKEE
jgi:hypothetical protein